MHRVQSLILFVLVTVVVVVAILAAHGAAAQPASPSFQALASALTSDVKAGWTSGISVGIVRQGKLIYSKTFGSISIDDTIPIASASKMPAVSAIMTLVDQGKLKLDDPVSRYMHNWPSDKSAVTIRQLLSHTAGFAPNKPACFGDNTLSLDQCARQISTLPLQATPGTAFIYSGDDYQIAGRIAEIVSGKPWSTFFRDSIARPCGLSNFTFGKTGNPWIAGLAASSLQDYAKILAMHLAGGMCGKTRVLSSRAVAEMQKDEIGKVSIIYSPFTDNYHYGLGWWIAPSPHGKASIFSDEVAFGATPWIDAHYKYGAIILMRSRFSTGLRIKGQIMPIIQSVVGH